MSSEAFTESQIDSGARRRGEPVAAGGI